jgi:N-methylcarbamate hydrolase
MEVDSTELPNYEIPPMDGIGTQEAIVDITHGLIDFISGCDTQPAAELNAWYHMLNCGFRLALIGETDYPCITRERPGVGRSYVRLEQRPMDDAGYEAWIRNLQKGKLYCGDGRSHFLDFKVNGRRSGEEDLQLTKASGQMSIDALVAARLEPHVPEDIRAIKRNGENGWHLENARIGTTREVAVELIVNGVAVQKTRLLADGKPRAIQFKVPIASSSWIALRILPSAHTHPVFVQVGGKPIRASKRSAQWCRDCVDKLWEVHSPLIRAGERAASSQAFDHARKSYDTIIGECEIV